MNLVDRLHMVHRFWRYRLRSEKDSIKFLLKQDLLGTTVLDVGAHHGIYSYWMSKKAGKSGKVIAFEPQPELESFLKDLRKTFRLDNLVIENKGLSNHCGNACLFRSEAGSGGAGFTGGEGFETIEVEVTTLDEYFKHKRVPRISFIKCDVEGHELQVFEGAENVLREHKPLLLFECHDGLAQKGDVFSFLKGLGYRGYFFHKRKRVDYSRFAEFAHENPERTYRDYVFVAGRTAAGQEPAFRRCRSSAQSENRWEWVARLAAPREYLRNTTR